MYTETQCNCCGWLGQMYETGIFGQCRHCPDCHAMLDDTLADHMEEDDE